MTTDETLVLKALKALRGIAGSYNRGGLNRQYKLAQDAIAAFERMADQQPMLWTTTEEALRR